MNGHHHETRQETMDQALLRLQELARSRGLRLTPQRTEILRRVAVSEDHPSAEDVYKEVKVAFPSISLDTVYRSLATFEKLGLVNRVPAALGQARFDGDVHDHHHFVCTRCGSISDFDWPDFDRADLPEEAKSLGRARQKSVVLHGVCEKCRKTGEGNGN